MANRAGVVTLRYQISGVSPFECDRCLMQTELNIKHTFEHIVVRKLEDNLLDDVFLVTADGVLDMSQIVSADLLLWLPQVLLCQPNCEGLCSECGANLNSGDCGCVKDNLDPRLAKLRELLKD